MAKTKKRPRLAAIIFASLQALLSVALVGLITRFDMLPYKYLNLLVVGLAALLLVPAFLACFREARVPSIVFSTLFSICLVVGLVYFVKTENALRQMGESEETVNFTVLTSTANSLNPDKALSNGKVAVVDAVMGEYIPEAKAAVTDEWADAAFAEYSSFAEAVRALLDGEVDGLLFFEGFRDMIEGSFEDFSVGTEIVKTIAIPEKHAQESSGKETEESEQAESDQEPDVPKDLTNSPFALVLLGSDSRARTLPANSNHDVNIVAIVNPVSKVILMISVPRDFYVSVPYSGMKDKLTHCGAWGGAECSMQTLNSLLDISASHYVKIGFTGFVSVVDSLGGIDVYSEVAFTAGAYHYKAGINHLYGEQALAFCRERYNLGSLGGDRQRGVNQMAVIKAIMQKALSPAILTNYLPLLNSLSGIIKYNFTQEEISSLVKMQLDDMAAWSIYSYSVNGTGKYDYTASYPREELYVMVPNQETIDNAKKYIQEVSEGKRPSIGN